MLFLLILFYSLSHTPSFGFNIAWYQWLLLQHWDANGLDEGKALPTRFRAEFSLGLISQPLVTECFHREGSWEGTSMPLEFSFFLQ